MPDDVRELKAASGVIAPSDRTMTPERCAHMVRIQTAVVRRIGEKYYTGQHEHGGNLWEKPGIIDMAIDEAVDQLVYLLTLREQLEARR